MSWPSTPRSASPGSTGGSTEGCRVEGSTRRRPGGGGSAPATASPLTLHGETQRRDPWRHFGSRSRRRPGPESRRRHRAAVKLPSPMGTLNEGRDRNPGDTRSPSTRSASSASLNEGRDRNPGDTGKRDGGMIEHGTRSTKAGTRVPATRGNATAAWWNADLAQRRPGRESRRHARRRNGAVAMDESALPRAVYEVLEWRRSGRRVRRSQPFGSKRPRLVRRASGFEPDTLPRRVDAHSRPSGPVFGVPRVQERVDTGAVEGLPPSRPVEATRLLTPRILPPTSLPLDCIVVAVHLPVSFPPVVSTPTYGQDGKAEERKLLDDRIGPLRSRFV